MPAAGKTSGPFSSLGVKETDDGKTAKGPLEVKHYQTPYPETK